MEYRIRRSRRKTLALQLKLPGIEPNMVLGGPFPRGRR